MTDDQYNAGQITTGKLTIGMITELLRSWQAAHALTVDGRAGPLTIATFGREPAEFTIGVDHWMTGVTRIPIDASWFGGMLNGGGPGGIVAHFTDTDPGTAINMAKRRQHVFGTDPDDRLASWHVTIETDGSIVQMLPFDRIGWHAGSSTALPIPGLGSGNRSTVGIELVGYGKEFPPAQVESAKRVWRAIVQRYSVAHEFAMLQHSAIDPTRRDDPGPVWMGKYAASVLEAAYGP